jgi:hypothetical protein
MTIQMQREQLATTRQPGPLVDSRYGAHRGTAGQASVVKLAGDGSISAAGLAQGDSFRALLFTQDVPISLLAQHWWGAPVFVGDVAIGERKSETSGGLLSLGTTGLAQISVTEPPASYGSATVATVSGVPGVNGFLVDWQVPNFKYLDDAAASGGESADPTTTIFFSSASVVQWGYAPAALGESSLVLPVLLRAADYTAAIRANNNVHVHENNYYPVIGVWETPSGEGEKL